MKSVQSELRARSYCRHGLCGLKVRVFGKVATIESTGWAKDSRMLEVDVRYEDGFVETVLAVDVELRDEWPRVCC